MPRRSVSTCDPLIKTIRSLRKCALTQVKQRVSALRRSQPAGSTTSCTREARFTIAPPAQGGDPCRTITRNRGISGNTPEGGSCPDKATRNLGDVGSSDNYDGCVYAQR